MIRPPANLSAEGVELTQPIINGRRIRTQQYEVAQSQREQAYLRFRQEAGGYRMPCVHSRLPAKELKSNHRNSPPMTAASYSEELLNSGLANYLDVLTARQNAVNCRLDLIMHALATSIQ